MNNIFYGYGILWTIILILYFLGWSDLCLPLDNYLLTFLVISISISFIIGYFMRKKLKFVKLENNPHKNRNITYILVILYVVEMLYTRQIPLLNVISGFSYKQSGFSGIPNLHLLITSFSIFYSFYLSYIYACFKEKKVLFEYLLIIMYFILLVQRQNIVICIIGFLNIMYAANSEYITKKIKSKKSKFMIILLCILLSFSFGVLGNIRYGNSWNWNDSSMITKLGKQNDQYPKYLPNEFFWSYIYLVSPLVNLNYNIKMNEPTNNLHKTTMEFVPEFIRNKLIKEKTDKIMLPVSSLTASTSYVKVYINSGYSGMYIMFLFQIIVCAFVLNKTYKRNKKYFIVVCNALGYFLILTFFTNTIVYSITAAMLLFSLISSFNFTIRRSDV